MTAQEYLNSTLNQLREPLGLPKPQDQDELIDAIYKLVTSKKFRKYSLTDEYAASIKEAIRRSVEANEPINMIFFGGCYKLWRLEEAPESDWAELFACVYYTKWVKPICEIYEPGVWFDYFLDDVIVSRINNLPESDVEAYRTSRQRVLDYLKPYQPKNLRMTLTGVGSLFESREAYEEALEKSIKGLSATLPGGIPELNEKQLAMTALNVKATPEQLAAPKWREKVELIHSAYMLIKGSTGYGGISNKIRVFTQPFNDGTCIAVGTTKDSIAKFWAGVGALKPRDGSFRQLVLSPSQLQEASFEWQDINLDGLKGKNFHKIRVLK